MLVSLEPAWLGSRVSCLRTSSWWGLQTSSASASSWGKQWSWASSWDERLNQLLGAPTLSVCVCVYSSTSWLQLDQLEGRPWAGSALQFIISASTGRLCVCVWVSSPVSSMCVCVLPPVGYLCLAWLLDEPACTAASPHPSGYQIHLTLTKTSRSWAEVMFLNKCQENSDLIQITLNIKILANGY